MTIRIFILLSLIKISLQFEICKTLNNNQSETSVSEECLNQMKIVCKNETLLWRMLDASSKYPISGMSYSNNKDLGNFDECIGINYGDVKGKYCGFSVVVANPFLEPIPDPFDVIVDKNIKSKDVLKSILSTCVPDKCTPKEFGSFFIFGKLTNILIFYVDAMIPITQDSNNLFEWGDIVFISFLAVIAALAIASTLYDYYLHKTKKKTHHCLLLSFSFLTNGQRLIHISNNPQQINCLNGLRFISMMWVIAGHGGVTLEQAPIINYAELTDYADNVGVQYLASAPISVDTFFFLSGFLLTYSYIKSQKNSPAKKQIKQIPLMIVHRYLRLTPALAVLYFTSITIFKFLGTGPMWGSVSEVLRKPCMNHWWSFFLYIQNYVNYNDMCLNHSWYLSADMQMFILAPLVLIPVTVLLKNNKQNHAIASLFGLIVICVIFPMGIRFADHTIDNVYDTHSRFNDYLIGVLLGVLMHDSRLKKFPFGKLTNLAIWCFVLNICVAFNLYYHNIIRRYNHTSDTLFYGLYRPIWCFSLAWLVYSCYHGYGGPINWFLSLPMFQVGARLSYCMYLLHAVVEMYYLGILRTPIHWSDYENFYVWCGHFIVTMIMSTIWSLSFESPMMIIEKFLFGKREKNKDTRV